MPKTISSPYILNPFYMAADPNKADSPDVQNDSTKQTEEPAAAEKDSSQNNTSPGKVGVQAKQKLAKNFK